MSNKNSDDRQKQKQSKKTKDKHWLKSFCNPKMLKMLIKFGWTTYQIGKWLIELLQD